MRRSIASVVAFIMVAAVAALLGDAQPAAAATDCPTVASALDAGALVVGESWLECSNAAANGITPAFPLGQTAEGGTSVLLTSGSVENAAAPNDLPNTTASWGTVFRGAVDTSVLAVTIDVPVGRNCLAFDFVFGSEEYSEYVGSDFNDGFIAELDTSTWEVSGSTISAPGNFAFDSDGNILSVNSALFTVQGDPDVVGQDPNATGTEYDGSTNLLRAQTAITPGSHIVYLSIFDASDDRWDSGVWIDNLTVGTVSDDSACDPGAQLSPPNAVIEASPTSGVAPLDVDFDGSESSDPDGGAIASYGWDFGDGSTDNGVATQHTFAAPGTYTVTLTVTDDEGVFDTATQEIEVTSSGEKFPPVAVIEASPTSGVAPLDVDFDGSESSDPDGGAIASYSWDFGDGSTDNGVAPQHTFAAADSYTVTLTVTDDEGVSGTATKEIEVGTGTGGTLKISKVFDPLASGVTRTFAIDWACDDLSAGTVELAGGQSETIEDIAEGAICTVTETKPTGAPRGWYFGKPVITGSPATITAGAPAEVTVENSIARHTSSLRIVKKVKGGPHGYSAAFDVHVECSADGGTYDRTIEYPTPKSVTIAGIPTNAECDVSEPQLPPPPHGYKWHKTRISGDPATIKLGVTSVVTVTNCLRRVGQHHSKYTSRFAKHGPYSPSWWGHHRSC